MIVAIGIDLDREQVRNVEHRRTLAEILADSLLFGEGITGRHEERTSTAGGGMGLPPG